MSVNLHLRFEIHGIKAIHELEDETLRNSIYTEAQKFLEEEGILDQNMIVDFIGQEGVLCGYTTYPIIISRSYLWVPEVTKRWEEMAYRVLGKNCQPKVEVEYPDED